MTERKERITVRQPNIADKDRIPTVEPLIQPVVERLKYYQGSYDALKEQADRILNRPSHEITREDFLNARQILAEARSYQLHTVGLTEAIRLMRGELPEPFDKSSLRIQYLDTKRQVK